MTCDACHSPDAEPTPNGHVIADGRWVNAVALLCAQCQRDDMRERMERERA